GPALRLRVEVVHRFLRQLAPALGRDGRGLLTREPELVPADGRERAVGAQPGERRRWIAAAHEDRAAAGWKLGDRVAHHLVNRRERRELVVAIEDDDERRRQPRVEELEEAPREDGLSAPVFRREKRQRR